MFRLDRLITLYLFHPLKRILPQPNGIRIPILMYHSISDDSENGTHPYYRINTSPKVFAEHMQFLHDNNYKVISLSDAVGIITRNSRLETIFSQPVTRNPQPVTGSSNQLNEPNKPNEPNKLNELNNPTSRHSQLGTRNLVVLTFDDGYRDFHTHAFPILKKYGFSATVFLPTNLIDSATKPGLKGKHHLNWDEVRELRDGAIAFGSHTVSHRQLRGLNRAEIEYETTKSKEVIEKELGQNVESFCYPYKFMEQDREFVRMMKTVLMGGGYKSAVTTRIGAANTENDIFMLRRIPINSDDKAQFLRAKLEGNYDWLQMPQKLAKYFGT